jgi:ABC-type branched-subunit amino acid transport system substrate-binding protein
MTATGRAKINPKYIEGCYVNVQPWDLKGPGVVNYLMKYKGEFGAEPNFFSGNSYEATWMLALAMKKGEQFALLIR